MTLSEHLPSRRHPRTCSPHRSRLRSPRHPGLRVRHLFRDDHEHEQVNALSNAIRDDIQYIPHVITSPPRACVRNHLSTPRLAGLMDADVFVWHGHTEVLVYGPRPHRHSIHGCANDSGCHRWTSAAATTHSCTPSTARGVGPTRR